MENPPQTHPPAQHTGSRVPTSRVKSGFRFRWWYALILVVVVAGIGLAVLRYSRAFGGGRVYVNGGDTGPYVEYDINLDGSVNLKESITGAEKKNVPFDQARTVGAQMITQAQSSGQPSESSSSTTSETTTSSSTPAASTPAQSATTESTSSATSQTPSTAQESTTSTTTESLQSINVSGEQNFQLADSQLTGVSQVEYFVDDASIGGSTSSPFTIQFDSSKLLNGNHILKATAKTSTGSQTYSVLLVVHNSSGWWPSLLGFFGL